VGNPTQHARVEDLTGWRDPSERRRLKTGAPCSQITYKQGECVQVARSRGCDAHIFAHHTINVRILRGNVSGLLIVNSHREWLAAWNAQMDVERVKQLEQQLATLREQLARAGGGHLRKAG